MTDRVATPVTLLGALPASLQDLALTGVRRRCVVRVPATSANLGPGFDVLGAAVDMANTLVVDMMAVHPSIPPLQIMVHGEGETALPRDGRNMVYRAFTDYCAAHRVSVPPLRIAMDNAIPVGRGLGSSAAAIIGGVMAANVLRNGGSDLPDLLRIGLQLEPHPDNMAAALWGGVVAAVAVQGRGHEPPIVRRIASSDVTQSVRIVLLIPDGHASTKQARAVLPADVSRKDAVFNLGRVALLITAWQTGDLSLLRLAMEDHLHQPQRSGLFPLLPRAIAAAYDAGALGAALSGAGSTVIAITNPDRASIVEQAMAEAARAQGLAARTLLTTLCDSGATVHLLPGA